MELGICIQSEQAAMVAPYYDYAELQVGSLLTQSDDETVAGVLSDLAHLSLPVRAFNVFVPRHIRLVGDDVEWTLVRRYVDTSVRRAAAVGGRLIVFGSGAARAVPDGFLRARAWAQLVRFLTMAADVAEPLGVTLAIEPLNSTESNIVNTYSEGVQLARDVDRLGVRVLADLFHIVQENEPIDDILLAPEWLAHVHLADTGRMHPGSGVYPLREFFGVLRLAGYRGAASVECRWGDDLVGEARASAEFLRALA
jgi:sugar phosphate isomerase/epimerase